MPIGPLKRLLRRDAAAMRRVPDGKRVYAVGDVHGRLDLFDRLLARIEADRRRWSGEAEVVLLGDYVDRGPDSAALLDRLARGMPDWADWTLLKGNHEQAMLDSFDGDRRAGSLHEAAGHPAEESGSAESDG